LLEINVVEASNLTFELRNIKGNWFHLQVERVEFAGKLINLVSLDVGFFTALVAFQALVTELTLELVHLSAESLE